MNISYYTIDDMRLGHDPKGITGWRIRYFLSLDKALAQYRTMSPRGIKTMGVTDGVRMLELVGASPCSPMIKRARMFWPQTTGVSPCGAECRRWQKRNRSASPCCG